MADAITNETGVAHQLDDVDDQEADTDDLLTTLDDYYQAEQDRATKRRRSNATGTITSDSRRSLPPPSFASLAQACYRSLSNNLAATAVSPPDSSEPSMAHPNCDESDLLGHLTVERKREMNRIYKRRFDARRKEQERLNRRDFVEEIRQTRPSKALQRKQRLNADKNAAWDGTFDNELHGTERKDCMDGLRRALGAEGLDECVCTVCDRLELRHKTRRIEDTDWDYMNKMKRSMKVSKKPDIPGDLVSQYRSPPHLPDLEGLMVSPRRITCYNDDSNSQRAWFSVCYECDHSIQQCKLPKFSIANGFYVGRLGEHLRGLTLPERFMTQLVSLAAITRVMRGGRHRCIRSHCIAFDCTPGPPILLLPRSIQDIDSYRVVMVGEFTPAQSEKVRKMHRVRNQQVREVFEFYKQNNHLYADIIQNEPVLLSDDLDAAAQALTDHIEDSTGELDDGINREQQTVRGENDAFPVVNENNEINVIERRVGLSDAFVPARIQEHPLATKTGNCGERRFEVRGSNKIASDVSGDLFARMFPHLFPFGRGHPGEARPVAVSVHECVKYYTMLSERQFAEDELFSLVAFDRISLRNMYIHNHFRCQRFPSLLDGYESLTGEQLGRAILENERRRQGCLPWGKQNDDVARRFLKTVEIGTKSCWGSNAERAQCRHKAFAYQARFGQPALFVTLTPNTDNSLVLAHYAGVSSVSTLFDAVESRLLGKAELREASLRNDCASTRLFMRQVDAFIKYALGFDPATTTKLPFRGLFGDVKAYFGMVETQGRGTLHLHILTWLNHCPSSSAAIERLLRSPDGDKFRELVISYSRSIVSNDLPIPVEASRCSKCSAPFSKLVRLPIPDSARQDPITSKKNTRDKGKPTEPALVQCSVCNHRFSSQHILRSALLSFRPNQWPMWEHPLTANEVKQQADKEAICRGTTKQALKIIDDREQNQASLKGNQQHEDISSELLREQNSAQMELCKSDDDPFRCDELTRLFEVSPPSVSDGRMAQQSIDYMVAALVIQLNQHLWNHTNSCFKQSRSTSRDAYCRYRFPRDLVETVSFDTSGVELGRKLGHEYVNGFNYEIMATFRCNHDVQVLLGGSDVTDRIFYCCKYVTKPQNRIDSQVAIAVAALKRREEREKGEAEDSKILARKRVAALMYNMTNRHEMAGPLAALYLYRGSCCYSSHTCVSLPLGDVIRQLTTADGYACTLVRERDDIQASKYHAVSFLDDYVCRPKILESLNLYEFAMSYFRRKNERTVSCILQFLQNHPLYETHSLGKRRENVVPVINGFRMPSEDIEGNVEIASKRAMLSLVLFKSFRTLESLIGVVDGNDEGAWVKAFKIWKTTRSCFIEALMENMEDFYKGSKKAADQAKEATVATNGQGNVTEGDDSSSDDNDNLAGDTDICYEEWHDDGDFDVKSLWEDVENKNVVLDSSALHPAACPTSAIPDGNAATILGIFKTHGLLNSAVSALASNLPPNWPPENVPTLDTMKQWVSCANTDNHVVSQSLPFVIPRDTQIIELLSDTLRDTNMAWSRSIILNRSPHVKKSFASVADISEVYTLNKRQHYALQIIGFSLFSRWKQIEVSDVDGPRLEGTLRDGQLLMFLGGEGGTGKSRIIDAVQSLCDSWGRSNSFVKTALTGRAATLISGRTLASFLLQIQKRRVSDEIMNVEIVIVDEVSMMKKCQLAQLDKRLRVAKRVPGVVFGGVHVILVGDFLQLPPVGGSPLYKDPVARSRQAKVSVDELAGHHLWHLFTDVIILKESVRFANDPEWGRGCQQARLGIWTPEFVDIINSRVMTRESERDSFSDEENMATFVTPDNMTRMCINNLFISTLARLLPDGEFPVRVVANFKGKLKALNRFETATIMALPDTKFGRMAPYLDLVVGMPIQVSQNVRAAKMVANGTLGTLEAIIYHPSTTFRFVHDSSANMTVKIPSVPPYALLVRVDRGSTAIALQGVGDANIFPLFFDAEAYNPCEITLPGMFNGVPRMLEVKIQQFPLVCAAASTVYKVQGETLKNMVVTEWRSKSRISNKREQPYLLVSRVTTRSAFRTLQPLTSDLIAWAHPPQAALEEENRLHQLCESTIAKLTRVSVVR